MEEYRYKWRHLNQSAKIHPNTHKVSAQRFRSKSKSKENHFIGQKRNTNLSKLLPNNKRQKQKVKTSCEQYYRQGKENERSIGHKQEVKSLKSQLSKLSSTPQNKQVIDATISLIHKYEQQIKLLQEKNHFNKKLNQFASNGPCHLQTHLYNSQQTNSLCGSSGLKPKTSTNITNYYFPMYQ